MASGGDDQQIRVMLIQEDKVVLEKKLYAHSSCVKGVILSKVEGQLVVSSSSYDQRFKRWRVSINQDSLSIDLI